MKRGKLTSPAPKRLDRSPSRLFKFHARLSSIDILEVVAPAVVLLEDLTVPAMLPYRRDVEVHVGRALLAGRAVAKEVVAYSIFCLHGPPKGEARAVVVFAVDHPVFGPGVGGALVGIIECGDFGGRKRGRVSMVRFVERFHGGCIKLRGENPYYTIHGRPRRGEPEGLPRCNA